MLFSADHGLLVGPARVSLLSWVLLFLFFIFPLFPAQCMSDSCVVGMKVGEARFLFSQVTIIGELVSFDYFGLTEGKIGRVREQPTAPRS